MDELKLLQENTWQMAEALGLDRRIEKLTGKRKVSFYSWDLDCLKDIVTDLQELSENKNVANRLAQKIDEAYRTIDVDKKR